MVLKTIDDFYEHSMVPTVRMKDLDDATSHLFAQLLYFLDRHIGLRHLFLLSVLVIYSFIGGYVFYYFETNGEAQAVPARAADLDKQILEIVNRYKSGNSNLTLAEKTAALKRDYKALLSTDGVFRWSTYYKTDEPDHWKWTLGSSFFYSMNVYTTVGYGSIAPETFAARCFTIFYGTLFCPLTWIIIRDLGQLSLVYFTTVYARLKLKL
ncbi:hypothetical protein Q1695_001091 [Nippostrongylus brasiliensis]|nr:hypothetical protein Q1695_001091 [Nippostrongylus brasiliensis]